MTSWPVLAILLCRFFEQSSGFLDHSITKSTCSSCSVGVRRSRRRRCYRNLHHYPHETYNNYCTNKRGNRILYSSPINDSDGVFSQKKLSSTSSNFGSNNLLVDSNGLLEQSTFERCCQVHKTITELKTQIPTLLTKPLTEQAASNLYEANFRLIVVQPKKKQAAFAETTLVDDNDEKEEDIILAASRDELINLSNAIVLGTTATRQANALVTSSLGSSGVSVNGRGGTSPNANIMNSFEVSPEIKSEIAIDPTLQAIRIRWETNLSIPLDDNEDNFNSGSNSRSRSRRDFRRRNLNGQRRRGLGQRARQRQRKLQGLSEFVLDRKTGKVTVHRLLEVRFANQLLNAPLIGQRLASLRQVYLGIQSSQLLQSIIPKSSPLDTMLSRVRDDIMKQITDAGQQPNNEASSKRRKKAKKDPKLYVVNSLQDAFYNSEDDDDDENSISSSNIDAMIPIDAYNEKLKYSSSSSSFTPPLPGSHQWDEYVIVHRIVKKFIHSVIPILSGSEVTTTPETIIEMIRNNATMTSSDGEILLQGRDRIASFYQNLASWRRTTQSTNWRLQKATLLNSNVVANNDDSDLEEHNQINNNEVCIIIDYVADTTLPGSIWPYPVSIRGKDKFVLYKGGPNFQQEEEGNVDYSSDEEEDNVEILIERVEQMMLTIDGKQDNALFMKSITSALDTGRFGSSDSVVMELLQRAVRGGGNNSNRNQQSQKRRRFQSPPKLPDVAAIRVYKIMSQLYRDIPSLILLSESSSLSSLSQSSLSPPVYDYMTENIELRGYLGETLARGSTAYNRVIGAVFRSWRAALLTGNVKLDNDRKRKEPLQIAVELSSKGSIRLSVKLKLKVFPIPGRNGNVGLMGVVPSILPGSPTASFPMTLSLLSEYVVDRETGSIYQHKLLESRVNGQLAPGDVLSRWIQAQVSSTRSRDDFSVTRLGDGDDVLRALTDTVSWIRSISEGGKRE